MRRRAALRAGTRCRPPHCRPAPLNASPPPACSPMARAGARIAAEVVGDEKLFAQWKDEMRQMADRIRSVRGLLQSELEKAAPGAKDWSFVTRQIGMFSFTGLTPAQVERMTREHHVYMTKDGRISLAGLSAAKTPYLAAAIADCVKNA